jgi:hypothetical protein
MSFIGVRPALLREEPGESPAYSTPRSWEMLSDVLRKFQGYKGCADIVPGIVGEGAAREFAAFVKRAMSARQMEEIILDPENSLLPTAIDGIHVLTTWLVYSADRDDVVNASAVLLSRLPAEFAVVLSREMLRARPAFSRAAGYKKFMKQHASLISQ